MLTLDTLIAVTIVVGAAVYLYRKFAGSRNSGGCGCASGGGCCSGRDGGAAKMPGCMSKH
jgi:hypothetical protein